MSNTHASVLELLDEYGPLSDEELVWRYRSLEVKRSYPNVSDQRIRTARADLVRRGSVREYEGHKEKSQRGRPMRLWQSVA